MNCHTVATKVIFIVEYFHYSPENVDADNCVLIGTDATRHISTRIRPELTVEFSRHCGCFALQALIHVHRPRENLGVVIQCMFQIHTLRLCDVTGKHMNPNGAVHVFDRLE